jgi:hemolysin III
LRPFISSAFLHTSVKVAPIVALLLRSELLAIIKFLSIYFDYPLSTQREESAIQVFSSILERRIHMSIDKTKDHPRYTPREEIANSLIHGFALVMSIIGLVLLLVVSSKLDDKIRVVSFSIYGASLIALYLSSTLYHSLKNKDLKKTFRMIDHTLIYILIAGSYTPILLISLRGPLGWTLMVLIWSIAALGIFYQVFFTTSKGKIGLISYIVMGWLCVVALPKMITNIPLGGLYLLFAGGLFYTVGTIFYRWHSMPYHHAVWHIFVLAGSASHYFMIFFYVLPK